MWIIIYTAISSSFEINGAICVSLSCSVFWGGREGYQTLLNTDVKRELDHMGAFFRMAAGT